MYDNTLIKPSRPADAGVRDQVEDCIRLRRR